MNRLFFYCCTCPTIAPGAPIEDTKLVGQPRGWGVSLREHPLTQEQDRIDVIVARNPVTGQTVRLLVHYFCPDCQ